MKKSFIKNHQLGKWAKTTNKNYKKGKHWWLMNTMKIMENCSKPIVITEMGAQISIWDIGFISIFSMISFYKSTCMIVQKYQEILHTHTHMHMCVCVQQCVNRELPDVQAGFSKGRGTRDEIANIHWIIEKSKANSGNSALLSVLSKRITEKNRKTSTSALLILPKPLTVWITTNFGKFFKRWKYQTTLTASWETCT